MAGAIKTDFILSAEIMTIALSAIPPSNIYMKTATLAVVAVGITVAVYGSVALIVKADDVGGLLMSNKGGRWGGITRAIGRGIVKAMPGFMKLLTIVGTAAMLWVGGNIIVHGLHELGWHPIYNFIHHAAESAAHAVGEGWAGITGWAVTAGLDGGVVGFFLGLLLIPLATRVIGPIWGGRCSRARRDAVQLRGPVRGGGEGQTCRASFGADL